MSSNPAYKLEEICAAGTFGTVCVARDLHTGRLVALKVLKQAHLHRPRVIARTRDEAAMMSQLTHPGIVRVDGLIEIDGRPLVVMEWVRGVSLEQLLLQHHGGLPLGEALTLVLEAARALGAAYTAIPPAGGPPMGIIHRDIKPSNMLLSVGGRLKIVDFGIAHGTFEGKEAKTMSMVLGARGYLAPERLDGHDDKPTCDIYSLGICLYELITGKHIVLSVHHSFHAEALEKNLRRVHPEGLVPEGVDELRAILGAMCHYFEERRPGHQEVVARLEGLLSRFGVRSDLPGFAATTVRPMFANRARVPPRNHPSYADLAFLDDSAANCPRPAPPDIDATIRQFLRRPNWPERREHLDMLLLENPHWSPAPFVEMLPEGVTPWWQFWSTEPDPRQVVAALDILARQIDAEVRRRVLPLRNHGDEAIATAANRLLSLF